MSNRQEDVDAISEAMDDPSDAEAFAMGTSFAIHVANVESARAEGCVDDLGEFDPFTLRQLIRVERAYRLAMARNLTAALHLVRQLTDAIADLKTRLGEGFDDGERWKQGVIDDDK